MQDNLVWAGGFHETDECLTKEENLALLEMKKKTILDSVHFVEVTSSHSVKRRSVSIALTDDVISSKKLRHHEAACENEKLRSIVENKTFKSEGDRKDADSRQKLEKEITRDNKLGNGIRGVGIAYFLQCVLRLAVDVGFAYMQCELFEFDVPTLYKCARWPCPETVSIVLKLFLNILFEITDENLSDPILISSSSEYGLKNS